MRCCDEHQRAGSWAEHRALASKLKEELYPQGAG